MSDLSDAKQNLLSYLEVHPGSTVKQIIAHLQISKQAVAKHLRELLTQNLIVKQGSPPQVWYSLASKDIVDSEKLEQSATALVFHLNLIDRAASLGVVHPVGSWPLQVMITPEIDLRIVSPELNLPALIQLGQELMGSLRQVESMQVSDRIQYPRSDQSSGYYLGLQLRFEGRTWHIHVWNYPETGDITYSVAKTALYLQLLEARPELRSIITKLKNQAYDFELQQYRHDLNAFKIYQAVLLEGLNSLDQILVSS